jgi:serine/threonine protein kinase
MTDTRKNSRPSCEKVLNATPFWCLSINHLRQKREFNKFQERFSKTDQSIGPENSFHAFVIRKILEHQKQDEQSMMIKRSLISQCIKNGKYQKEFEELDIIASGSFSIVYKARSKLDNMIYAVKKIPFSSNYGYYNSFKNELDITSDLSERFVIKSPDNWVEENYMMKDKNFGNKNFAPDFAIFKSENFFILHIQMEYCSMTLRDSINKLNTELNQNEVGKLTPIGYFISCELFSEILDSIDYLHRKNIIHRDLKPTNILISEGKDGRFVKIADFGLAIIHSPDKDNSHTQASGTLKYMAPEVLRTRKYDTKADIYSLGVIMAELFNFNIYK